MNTELKPGETARLRPRTSWSLSLVVAVQTGLVIALAMAVYAVFQHLNLPEVTVRELIFRHLWHVAVLGGLIYLCTWAVFRWSVGRTLNALFVHMYAVSKGDLRPVEVQTRIAEMITIVDGVNLLVRQIQQSQEEDLIAGARAKLAEIRSVATVENGALDAISLLALLDELEIYISGLTHGAGAGRGAEGRGGESKDIAAATAGDDGDAGMDR